MKQLRIAVIAVFCIICCGCGHGLIGTLPVVHDQNNASEVFVLRGYQWFGHAISAYVSFDNNEFLAIRAAEYTKFLAPPGNHTIAVKAAGSPWYTISILLVPKERHYFSVTKSAMGFYIEPISEKDAGPYMAEDVFVPLDNTKI